AEGLASAQSEAAPTFPPTRPPEPVDTTVHPPTAIAVLTAPVSSVDSPALRTTVSGASGLPRRSPPTIESVRAAADLAWPAALIRAAPGAGSSAGTLIARGSVPLTRQARTGPEASAVRGSAIDGQQRLADLTAALGGTRPPGAAPPGVAAARGDEPTLFV